MRAALSSLPTDLAAYWGDVQRALHVERVEGPVFGRDCRLTSVRGPRAPPDLVLHGWTSLPSSSLRRGDLSGSPHRSRRPNRTSSPRSCQPDARTSRWPPSSTACPSRLATDLAETVSYSRALGALGRPRTVMTSTAPLVSSVASCCAPSLLPPWTRQADTRSSCTTPRAPAFSGWKGA